MGPLKLVKMARQARKQWSDLPAQEREALRGQADNVRDLARELSRLVARRGAPATDASAARTIAEVTHELTTAVSVLSRAVAPGAAAMVKDNAPRSVQLGARVLKLGARYGIKQVEQPRARPDDRRDVVPQLRPAVDGQTTEEQTVGAG